MSAQKIRRSNLRLKINTLNVLLIVSIILLGNFCISAQESTKDTPDELEKLLNQKYEKFRAKFNKTYANNQEMTARFQVFKQNYLKAKMKSLEAAVIEDEEYSGKNFGTTEFMDMSEEEFAKVYLTLNATELPADTQHYFEDGVRANRRFLEDDSDPVPDSWDWTKKGAVNPIRNQGLCGGCWAFSAVANIEGQYFLKNGKLPKFSEQQMIDCDPNNWGCTGGIMHTAIYYAMLNGLEKRKNYPYEFTRGYCRFNPQNPKVEVLSYISAGTDDEEKIKEFLYRWGPLAVTINANWLQYYTGGVINLSYEQCPYQPTHGVNLVGYGTTKSGYDYWIVRNTWGSRWGENGNFRIARGRGLCGINKYVVSAVLP